MIARNRNGVELRHVLGAIGNDIANDAHARNRWINVGITHHKFFQNVVLNRSRKRFRTDALLFRSHDIARKHRQYRSVHRHGYRYFVQRNAVEQDLHILNRIDSNTRLAHITCYSWVIGVVSSVGCEIKGNRDTLATRRQCLAIEGITLFRRRKPGILTNSPPPTSVHSRLRSSNIGTEPRHSVRVRKLSRVLSGVKHLHWNIFRRKPGELVRREAFALLFDQCCPRCLRCLIWVVNRHQ